MGMYGLLEGASGQVTAEQVEQSLSGNLCRCTGYRPILDAFKSFACDGGPDRNVVDIEDLNQYHARIGRKCGDKWANGVCDKADGLKEALELVFVDERQWHKVYTIKSLLDILSKSGTAPYMLVAGDTAHGKLCVKH